MKVVLGLHLHQPWRLARFRYLDIGSDRPYFDEDHNLALFREISQRSYRPALGILERTLRDEAEFRLALSLSGVWLEQARRAEPELLNLLESMARTGRLSLLAETFHHSLAFLLPPPELQEQVDLHRKALWETFSRESTVLRLTELAYSDDLARFAASQGFLGMVAEGWDPWLKGRSPNHLFASSVAPELRVLLRNYRLSDDIGFRFSARDWSEYPLTAEKFSRWISRSDGEVVSLFLDFETFGEHHRAETGILDFLGELPRAVLRETGLEWASLEEALRLPVRGHLSHPKVLTWADRSRDLGAWLGNDLQISAFEALKKVGTLVRLAGDRDLLETWRRLTTSDHLYYMYLGGDRQDAEVHRHFSSYSSPFDAYANFMNVLTDLRQRAQAALDRGHPKPRGGKRAARPSTTPPDAGRPFRGTAP
jgi:alpha-amylase